MKSELEKRYYESVKNNDKKEKTTFTFSIEKDVLNQLNKILCEKNKPQYDSLSTISALIREAINDYIEKNKKKY